MVWCCPRQEYMAILDSAGHEADEEAEDGRRPYTTPEDGMAEGASADPRRLVLRFFLRGESRLVDFL